MTLKLETHSSRYKFKCTWPLLHFKLGERKTCLGNRVKTELPLLTWTEQRSPAAFHTQKLLAMLAQWPFITPITRYRGLQATRELSGTGYLPAATDVIISSRHCKQGLLLLWSRWRSQTSGQLSGVAQSQLTSSG